MATRKSKTQTTTDPDDRTGWKYRWNDSEVDQETYDRLTEEHRVWVVEQERKAAEPIKEEKTRRKKK